MTAREQIKLLDRIERHLFKCRLLSAELPEPRDLNNAIYTVWQDARDSHDSLVRDLQAKTKEPV